MESDKSADSESASTLGKGQSLPTQYRSGLSKIRGWVFPQFFMTKYCTVTWPTAAPVSPSRWRWPAVGIRTWSAEFSPSARWKRERAEVTRYSAQILTLRASRVGSELTRPTAKILTLSH